MITNDVQSPLKNIINPALTLFLYIVCAGTHTQHVKNFWKYYETTTRVRVILIRVLLYLTTTRYDSLSQQTTVFFEFWLRTDVQYGGWPRTLQYLSIMCLWFVDRYDSLFAR